MKQELEGNSGDWNVNSLQGLWQNYPAGSALMGGTIVEAPAKAGICLPRAKTLDCNQVENSTLVWLTPRSLSSEDEPDTGHVCVSIAT